VSEVTLSAPEPDSPDASEELNNEVSPPAPPASGSTTRFSEPVDFDGVIRPARRTVYQGDENSGRVVSEQRISDVGWRFESDDEDFEPPQTP
jgi:hypothetical protein